MIKFLIGCAIVLFLIIIALGIRLNHVIKSKPITFNKTGVYGEQGG